MNAISVLNRYSQLSDQELEAVYLRACAENFQWRLDSTSTEGNHLVIKGLAITLAGEPQRAQFLINGIPFEQIEYPIPSPDLGETFRTISGAQTARFVCKTAIDWERTFQNGFACLEFLDGSGREEVRRRAWYLPNPKDDLPIPEAHRVRRVIGVPDPFNYVMGGAATYKRLEHYLEQRFSKTFNDFYEILDWACGCGRVARNFRWTKESKVWGVDIDGDNIAWCRKHLPHGQFLQTSLLPPLLFPGDPSIWC